MRFYISTANPDISPAFDASWEHTTGAERRVLVTDPVSNAGPNGDLISPTPPATSSGVRDFLAVQAISAPISKAGTITGKFSAVFYQGLTSTAFQQVIVRVVSADGTTVRGTLIGGTVNTTTSTFVNDSNYAVLGLATRVTLGVNLSAVSCQVGDRIVFELGCRNTNSSLTTSNNVTLTTSEVAAYGDLVPRGGLKGDYAWGARSWMELDSPFLDHGLLGAEEYRFYGDGPIINASPEMPFTDLDSVEGLDSAPVGLSTSSFEGMHGAYVSSRYEDGRTVTLSGMAYADPSDLDSYLTRLKSTFSPVRRPKPLYFGSDDDKTYRVSGLPQGLRYTKDRQRSIGKVPTQAQIVCSDPRIYRAGPPERLTTFPVGITTTQVIEYSVLGNRDTPARILLYCSDGSITTASFQLRNLYGLMSFTYTAPASFPLLPNHFGTVIVDTDTKRALRTDDGTGTTRAIMNARKNMSLYGAWLNLAPGKNVVTFNCAGAAGSTASYEVLYTPAWS